MVVLIAGLYMVEIVPYTLNSLGKEPSLFIFQLELAVLALYLHS